MASIVLIDSQSDRRARAAQSLADAGHHVVEAADARGALAALRDHRPDCVVLSLPVPNLEGHGLLGYLRSLGPRLPVVVLCDGPDANMEAVCERIAARALAFRPLSAQALQACVEQALVPAAAPVAI